MLRTRPQDRTTISGSKPLASRTDSKELARDPVSVNPKDYSTKLDQILDYRKHFPIIKRRDSSLFKTDVDLDKKVKFDEIR